MNALSALLSTIHVVGLAAAVGSATVKAALLLKCSSDPSFAETYLRVVRPITRLIIAGLVLLIVSGAGWLLLGYPFTPLLIAKIALVTAIFVLGPIIDNAVEPRFRALAPAPGAAPSAGFLRIQKRYVTLELVATALFYLIIVGWTWR